MTLIEQAAHCLHTNQLPQAEGYYQQVLASQPNNGHAYLGLGCIALKVQQYDKAISLLKTSCELLPSALSPLLKLSEAFNAVGAESDSLTVLHYAQKRFPAQPEVHYQLGLQQQSLGEIQQSVHSFQQVVALSDDTIVSYACLELTRLGQSNQELLAVINQRLDLTARTPQEKTVLHYAKANVLDLHSQYTEAWQHYQQANQLQLQSCDFTTEELKPFFAKIQAKPNQLGLSQRRASTGDAITPIFILGLPRTGSTLLEFLLTHHPQIGSVGEVSFISDEVAQFLYQSTGLGYPDSLQISDQTVLDNAAALYLTKLAAQQANKSFVIDKLPANFQSIGLIYKLFPQAKVILMQRNLPEVACSIYRNYFAQNEPYFCSLPEFADYTQLYTELMTYWQQHCKDFIYPVNYQDLVQDKSHTLSQLLQHLGLSSEPMSVNTPTTRSIKTLSNVQVRQEINAKPMANWLNYADYLAAFTQAQRAS